MNSNIKKTIMLGMLIALIGAECWGADPGHLLLEAARFGKVEVIDSLIQQGINVNERNMSGYGETPLMLAASGGYDMAVGLLLDKGADVNAKDYRGRTALNNKGRTALIWAIINWKFSTRENYNNVVRLLASAPGAELNEPDPVTGNTPLMMAALLGKGGAEVVQALLEAGANKDIVNRDNMTALELAYGRRGGVDDETVEMLESWVPMGG